MTSFDVLSSGENTAYGAYVSDGGVVPALSCEKRSTECPSGVYGAHYSPSIGKFIVYADGGVYVTENGADYFATGFDVSKEDGPFAVEEDSANGRVCVLAGKKVCNITSQTAECGTMTKTVRGGVLKNGRLFALSNENPYLVLWSGAGGAVDWAQSITNAGYVYINAQKGRILKLAVYKQRIMIICENGLAYLNAYGTPENFKLVYVDGVTGRIDENSVAVAGNKLIFLSGGALWAYDGIKAEKPDIPLVADMGKTVCAAGLGNDYAVSAQSKKLGRQIIFVFDVASVNGYYIDAQADALCTADSIYVFGNGGVCALVRGKKFTVEACGLTFGTGKRKVLKSLFIDSAKPVCAKVTNGVNSRIYADVTGFCRIEIGGAQFKISLIGESPVKCVKAYTEG